jgi:hypothetical protein
VAETKNKNDDKIGSLLIAPIVARGLKLFPMKNINFSDQELEHMISNFLLELAYAEDEVADIKEIL